MLFTLGYVFMSNEEKNFFQNYFDPGNDLANDSEKIKEDRLRE